MNIERFARFEFARRVKASGVFLSLATASAIALGWTSLPAMAQTSGNTAQTSGNQQSSDLDTIVVTAQRREELSRDVPITITTVNEVALKEANVDSLISLPKLSPGVRFDMQGAYVQPTIRGIGTTIALTQAGSSVGIYVDGFYVPNSLSLDFNFLNVDNIQVLKGPQGTLFGRNATGGAILIKTPDPSTETKAIVETSYERFNAAKVQAYATTGLSTNIAFNVEGQFSSGDGFVRNIYNGSLTTGGGFTAGAKMNDPGAYEKWTIRTGLKVDFSDSASLLLRYEHADNNDPTGQMNGAWVQNGQVYSSGAAAPGTLFGLKRGEIALNQRASFQIKTDTVQLTGKFDLGFANLTSYSQYHEEKIRQFLDMDFSSASVLGLELPEKASVITQEFLLNSKPLDKLQYTAGLFFYQGKSDTDINLSLGGGTYFPFNGNGGKTRTYAAYGDATYEVVGNLYLTGGLRFSHDEIKDPYFQTTPGVRGINTVRPDFQDDRLSPRVVLRYKPNDNSSVYASFTKGYKSAVPDSQGTSFVPGGPNYHGGFYLRPEDINAYEVGYKFSDRALSVEVAGFYSDYKNLQNSYYVLGSAVYSNAAKSKIKGIDFSLQYQITPQFEVSAAATYLDAKYTSYKNAGYFNPLIIGGAFVGFDTSRTADASGNQMQRAPQFSATFGARYRMELAGGELVTSANLYDTSKIYFDPAHQFGQGAYDILGARIQWTDPSKRYTVAVFGDNLTDTSYITQANVSLTGAGTIWGSPATYGISLRVQL